MKTPASKNSLLWILLVLLVVFSGMKVYGRQGAVVETIKKATAPVNDEERVDSVLTLPINTVLVKPKYQGGFFWTETRKDKVERFECSQCHNNKEVKIARAAEIAHGDIILVHGGKEKPLECFTCHKKDERDFLVTETDLKVDMDHSYQMCGQCHFRQKKDWVGGAHGKRVSYWAGKRVVKNCTSCHDPHSPLFEKRWPRTYSRPLSK
jgi:hypothetical protein